MRLEGGQRIDRAGHPQPRRPHRLQRAHPPFPASSKRRPSAPIRPSPAPCASAPFPSTPTSRTGKSQAAALDRAEVDRQGRAATGLPRLPRRRRANLPRNFCQSLLRALAGHRHFLHGAGVAIQQLHPSLRRPCSRCPSASAAPSSRYCSPASRSISTRLIGLVLLMGIVKKNSILLVEFTNAETLHRRATRCATRSSPPARFVCAPSS